MVAKYGYPTNADGDAVTGPELVVIGYGKVGGLELSYSSDLDLVLLHNSYAMGATTGERSQENGVFYTRMGQRMIHILTTQTRAGDLYEVDMRLRPSGNLRHDRRQRQILRRIPAATRLDLGTSGAGAGPGTVRQRQCRGAI